MTLCKSRKKTLMSNQPVTEIHAVVELNGGVLYNITYFDDEEIAQKHYKELVQEALDGTWIDYDWNDEESFWEAWESYRQDADTDFILDSGTIEKEE
jgi:hypothetical protein